MGKRGVFLNKLREEKLDILGGPAYIVSNKPATPLSRWANAHLGRVFFYISPKREGCYGNI
jgi:hypothetical protein